MEEIRKEIEAIEQSANRIKNMSMGNNAIQKNAEIILTFAYILKFITPVEE